jgi:hypothetical protein
MPHYPVGHFLLGSTATPSYFVFMPDASEIPYLLNLLDDESEEIRDMIQQALMRFGPALEQEVFPYENELDPEKRLRLKPLYKKIRKQAFEQDWPGWLDIPGYAPALEAAFSSLSSLEYGYSRPPLSALLDDLAEQFSASTTDKSSGKLMHFLFGIKGIGPPQADYYHPRNSNLTYVIESREGIQISLACVAILTAHRLGLPLFGLNVPGHFMILQTDTPDPVVLDPFTRGHPISAATLNYLKQSLQLESYASLVSLKASPATIIQRVLRNIMNAWDRQGNPEEVAFYERSSLTLLEAIREKNIS